MGVGMDKIVEDLEVKVAYHEDALEQLNDVIVKQQLQIEALQRQMTDITGQTQALMPLLNDGGADDVPPHY